MARDYVGTIDDTLNDDFALPMGVLIGVRTSRCCTWTPLIEQPSSLIVTARQPYSGITSLDREAVSLFLRNKPCFAARR
jgi:hypothetical protein